MKLQELLTLFEGYVAQLRSDAVAEIDFVKLQADLESAGTMMAALEQRADTGRRLLAAFREDMLRRARAVARLTGRSAVLTEKAIASEGATLDELLALKHDLDNEFETTFARTLGVPRNSGVSEGATITQYKVG